MKEQRTNVMRILTQKGIAYTPHFPGAAAGDPGDDRDYGGRVAAALGIEPARALKTLAARGASGGVYVFVLPVPASLDLRAAARAVGEKSVELLHQAELLPVTGYVRGGCSPIGMKKAYPTVVDAAAAAWDTVFISAGRPGAQAELAPAALVAAAGAVYADIAAQ